MTKLKTCNNTRKLELEQSSTQRLTNFKKSKCDLIQKLILEVWWGKMVGKYGGKVWWASMVGKLWLGSMVVKYDGEVWWGSKVTIKKKLKKKN